MSEASFDSMSSVLEHGVYGLFSSALRPRRVMWADESGLCLPQQVIFRESLSEASDSQAPPIEHHWSLFCVQTKRPGQVRPRRLLALVKASQVVSGSLAIKRLYVASIGASCGHMYICPRSSDLCTYMDKHLWINNRLVLCMSGAGGAGSTAAGLPMAAQEAVTAIHRAATDGDIEAVARMLDEDTRLLSSVWVDYTLLRRAAWEGHIKFVSGAAARAGGRGRYTKPLWEHSLALCCREGA